MNKFTRPDMDSPAIQALIARLDDTKPWMPPFNFRPHTPEEDAAGVWQMDDRPKRLIDTRWLRIRRAERPQWRGRFNIRMWIGRYELVWAPVKKKDWMTPNERKTLKGK